MARVCVALNAILRTTGYGSEQCIGLQLAARQQMQERSVTQVETVFKQANKHELN